MGLFKGLTSQLFQQDTAGRTVWVPLPFSNRAYLVSESDSVTIQRAYTTFLVCGVMLQGLGVSVAGLRAAFATVPIALLSYFPVAWYLARRLEASSDGPADLPRPNRRATMRRNATAMGRPTLILGTIWLVAGAGFCSWQAFDRPVWLVGVALCAFSAGTVAYQLLLLGESSSE